MEGTVVNAALEPLNTTKPAEVDFPWASAPRAALIKNMSEELVPVTQRLILNKIVKDLDFQAQKRPERLH